MSIMYQGRIIRVKGNTNVKKVTLWNEDGNDSYNDIDEEMDDIEIMGG